VKTAVKKMIETGDLEKISVKSIKNDLKKMFSEPVVSAQKDNIKHWIELYSEERSNRDDAKAKKGTKKGDKDMQG